jgi:hypothetical protein
MITSIDYEVGGLFPSQATIFGISAKGVSKTGLACNTTWHDGRRRVRILSIELPIANGGAADSFHVFVRNCKAPSRTSRIRIDNFVRRYKPISEADCLALCL